MMDKNLRNLLLGTSLLCALSQGCTDKQTPPNILFIMSDDHTTQGIGAYDDPRFRDLDITPAIDRLAEEGMLFTNVFCTNSICTPSRATILTGQYNHTNGVYDLYDPLPPDKQYLPVEMKKADCWTIPLSSTPGTRDSSWENTISLIKGGCTKNPSGCPC